MSAPSASPPEAIIVGVGYVGLTLAAALADQDVRVLGYDRSEDVVAQLNRAKPHLFEPGLERILADRLGRNLRFDTRLPPRCAGTVIICVSTPVGPDGAPDLSNLRSAVQALAERLDPEALVVVRSTVPVGTCRTLVLPALRRGERPIRLAYCPERTIQGQALTELRRLPQVVGALDTASLEAAVPFWQRMTSRVVPVSSLEAAEMVKLINNCHTDLLYSFGNEVALMARRVGLDPMELIHAANVDYPRPDVARPGFVGGPCMSKDPYLLLSSMNGYRPELVQTARRLNESVPRVVAEHLIERLGQQIGCLDGAKVLLCGFAYKGWPVTDDIRSAPTATIVEVLRHHPLRLHGHDYLVRPEAIAAMGVTPVRDLAEGFDGAQAAVFVNEHPDYRTLPLHDLIGRMRRPAVLSDCWRMFAASDVQAVPDVHYAGIGYG
jgi:UDP-N-acetyl-D-mannosaminuronic acid dehydrogenase